MSLIIVIIHFVVFSSRSILAYSFGEWILEKIYVPPIDIQGAFSILINSYIGPVPAEETEIIEVPKTLFADFWINFT